MVLQKELLIKNCLVEVNIPVARKRTLKVFKLYLDLIETMILKYTWKASARASERER